MGGIYLWFMKNTNVLFKYQFYIKDENNKFVSFNGQTFAFRLSIKVVQFYAKTNRNSN